MSTPAPTFSVCLPTFERGEVLEQAIDSVLNQTFADFELVVSDNASSYDISQRLARYRDSRLRILRQPSNLGMVRNFNACINASRGRFIKPLCDDDAFHPELLQRVHAQFSQADFVAIRDKQWWGLGKISWWPVDNFAVGIDVPGLTPDVLKVDCVSPTNVAFTRQLWERIGPYNEQIEFSFDYDLSVRARSLYRTARISTPLCVFRRWEQSATMLNANPFRNLEESVALKRFLWLKFPDQKCVVARRTWSEFASASFHASKCLARGQFRQLRGFFSAAAKSSRFLFPV